MLSNQVGGHRLQQWRLGERIAQGHFINRDSGVTTEAVPGKQSVPRVQGTPIMAKDGWQMLEVC